jgi:hypothetical protein
VEFLKNPVLLHQVINGSRGCGTGAGSSSQLTYLIIVQIAGAWCAG